ncbi:unnamed protein product [Spirodela intermedia]|uniref:RING-type E3 ubiquitin transferase n=1 Tax=Spirodela intermedia TaxID=51605 RepID=A0A7I8J2I3_SPIIN|nr:unnamed protein product [Spirodela intermedia]CAA6663591.1 unnamed protein product [Spirodela intermedia]
MAVVPGPAPLALSTRRRRRRNRGSLPRRRRRLRSQAGNVENYFVGPGVDELLFERLGRGGDQRGPPPAPRAAIDALPTVKIKQRHLRGDSACPVCKDKFELGAGARELPCKHLYHSDCIVPWLQLHNSCPVCRQELPSSSSAAAAADRGGGGEPHGRRNPLSFLWPFRAAAPSSNSRYHRSESGEEALSPGSTTRSTTLATLIAPLTDGDDKNWFRS